jgi:UDPglucose--hexose-1-phosphate uridylyltransferase
MHKRTLCKPDGRALTLYATSPLPDTLEAPSPDAAPHAANGHLRWHPLRAEWVAYATHRQSRTFLPPPSYNPLAPMQDPRVPTEVPAGPWQVAVFDNLFPAFTPLAHDPPALGIPTAPARGVCEVVVFTQDSQASLGSLPLSHLALIVDVWADRTEILGARSEVAYVFPFENRGVEVGVTLRHPHGQLYAYPFVPPLPARELEQQRRHLAETGRGLIDVFIERERREAVRMIYEGTSAVAFMPVCARYAYEVWIAPIRPVPLFTALTSSERYDYARALKTVLMKFDRLWDRPLPYVLVFHQAPTDGQPHPEAHLHAEIYPALRMRDRLKYLAGSELGAGVFTADTVPEEKAEELRRIEVDVEG